MKASLSISFLNHKKACLKTPLSREYNLECSYRNNINFGEILTIICIRYRHTLSLIIFQEQHIQGYFIPLTPQQFVNNYKMFFIKKMSFFVFVNSYV